MPQEPAVIYFILGIYVLVVWLIVYQVEIRVRLYARMKCRFGYHRRESTDLGKTVKQYRCVFCGKPKDHPHLQIIDGGKKDLGSKFRW